MTQSISPVRRSRIWVDAASHGVMKRNRRAGNLLLERHGRYFYDIKQRMNDVVRVLGIELDRSEPRRVRRRLLLSEEDIETAHDVLTDVLHRACAVEDDAAVAALCNCVFPLGMWS